MRSIRAAGRRLSAFALAYVAYILVAAVIHGSLRGIGDDVNGGDSYSLVPISNLLFDGVFAQHLQSWLGTDNPVLVEFSFQAWFSLFWVSPLLAIVAYAVGGPRAFYRLLAVHAIVVFSADALYALFPTRPPWMDVDVVRIVALEAGGVTGNDTNPYAAMPSLHVAIPVAYATWFWRQQDLRLKAFGPVLALWAAAMSFAVVYTGEHFVFCVVLGALIAIEANLILEHVYLGGLRLWIHQAREARAREATPVPTNSDAAPAFAEGAAAG